MSKSVSANYLTEEAKSAGATPKFYAAMMRIKTTMVSGGSNDNIQRCYFNNTYDDTVMYFVDDEGSGYGLLSYFVDDLGGTHTNTEEYDGTLFLQAGKASGNWVSDTMDTGHLTPNVIYDKIVWTETLNSGTTTVQIRTALTQGAVAAASYTDYTNDTYDHTERLRWWQNKILLTAYEADSEQSTVRVSLLDGQAFLWDTGQDFTAYIGDGVDNSYSVLIKDTSNNEVTGFCGIEGAGETLGSELHDDNNAAADPNSSEADATAGWGNDPTGGTIASDNTDPSVGTFHFDINATGNGEGALASAGTIPTVANKLYKLTCAVKVISGSFTIDIVDSGDASVIKVLESTVADVAYTNKTYYWTAAGTNERIRIIGDSGGAAQIYVDNLSVKEVTDPPADVGIRVYSTRIGSTQNFTSVGGGFDPNDTLTYSIYISPELKNVTIRHKALIPKTDYVDISSLEYGTDPDFFDSYASGISMIVDNKSHQFEKYQSTAYIYGLEYFYKKFETWAGFLLSDSTIEYLEQFVGEIENISTDSGSGANYNATIQARDFIYNKLANTIIGESSSSGDPAPYMSGSRYRVPCKEIDSASYIYEFYADGTITSIDGVYVRDTNNQLWVTAPSNTTSVANKRVTFDSDPQSEVSVDITVNATTHPIEIMYDILENKLELDPDYWDTTSMDLTQSRTSSVVVGVSFENISILEAFKLMLPIMDAAMYVEGGKLKVVSYYPDLDSSQSFGESDIINTNMSESVSTLSNKAAIYYADYEDDKTKYTEITDQTSTNKYGIQDFKLFSFKYEDPVSITSSTYASEILDRWLRRHIDYNEVFVFDLPLDSLRTEIFDVVDITLTKHNLSAAEMFVLSKSMDLFNYTGTITCIRYPHENWLYWHDASDTENLRYLVDGSGTTADPVPEAQAPYQSYYY